MTSKEIYETIKNAPYRDGEALIDKYTNDKIRILEDRIDSICTDIENVELYLDRLGVPSRDKGIELTIFEWVKYIVTYFYCENRDEKGMMQCGQQCDTCKKFEAS